jgi:Threonine aldolase
MVYFGIRKEGLTAGELANRCRLKGVLFNVVNPKRVRLVTHLDVTRGDVREAARIIQEEAASR